MVVTPKVIACDSKDTSTCSSNNNSISSKDVNSSYVVQAISHNSSSISDRCKLSTSILPVYIFSADHPENKVFVYALLGSMSDIRFVASDVLTQVNSSSAPVTFTLAAMVSPCSTISCRKPDNLLIQSFHGGPAIQLPSAYSRDYIPAEYSRIPTPDKVLKCSHMKDIASESPVEQ